MTKRSKRKWRYSRHTQYHYWEDDTYGHGYITKTENGEYWAVGKDAEVFTRLGDAKKFVERSTGKVTARPARDGR